MRHFGLHGTRSVPKLGTPTSSLPPRNEGRHMVINPHARPTAGRRLSWLRKFGRIIAAPLRPKAACLCNLQEPVPHHRHRVLSRRCNPPPCQSREQLLACAHDKGRCFNDGDANKFTVPTEIKPPHALTPCATSITFEGGIIIAEMMAIPGTQLWAKAILGACCKRDTAVSWRTGNLDSVHGT